MMNQEEWTRVMEEVTGGTERWGRAERQEEGDEKDGAHRRLACSRSIAVEYMDYS